MEFLEQIVKAKRIEVRRLKPKLREWKARAKDATPTRPFESALVRPDGPALVAEIKRASPAAGSINLDLDPARIAHEYEAAGASAISCLTDREFFRGTLEDFAAARGAATLPVLRKDFIIDECQVWESRAAAADAILLIARILDPGQLKEYGALARETGMAALFEVHDERDLEKALAAGPSIIAINNRDLVTFEVSLQTTARLADSIPDKVVCIAESGVRTRQDVLFLGAAGADAVLVGTEIASSTDPAARIRELLGLPPAPRMVRRIRLA